jgi:hypothetical protein
VLALVAIVVSGCSGPPSASPGSPAASSAAPLSIPPLASALPPSSAASAHAFRYELVLSGTEGSTTTRSVFVLDVSEGAPASINFGKNVRMGSTHNRSDVGTILKPRLTFDSGTPRLDVEANVSWIDAAGKGHRLKTEGGAQTPPGTSAAIFDTVQDGRQLRLTATAKPVALGGGDGAEGSTPAKDGYVADVVLSHSDGITTAKESNLKLSLAGEASANAQTSESLTLGDADAGPVPHQTIGTRVKASARPRGAGVALDLYFEVSGLEPNAVVRKIIVQGPLFAPLDKPTVAFTGEEDGHGYTVTVTPRAR